MRVMCGHRRGMFSQTQDDRGQYSLCSQEPSEDYNCGRETRVDFERNFVLPVVELPTRSTILVSRLQDRDRLGLQRVCRDMFRYSGLSEVVEFSFQKYIVVWAETTIPQRAMGVFLDLWL